MTLNILPKPWYIALWAFGLLSACGGLSIPYQESSEKTGGPGASQSPRWKLINDSREEERKKADEEAAAKEHEEESEVLEERRRGYDADKPIEVQKGTRLFWAFGPRLDAFGGDLSLVVGGRLQMDAATFSRDPNIEAAFGEPDSGGNLRRAFVELGGVYKHVEMNLWLDFADIEEANFVGGSTEFNNTVDFRNVFLGLFDLPVIGGIRAGYFKEPFGLEEITSSNDISFMERSLTDAFVERRNLGVMLHRRFTEDRRISTALGAYKDANNDLETFDGYGVTGRITGLPWFAMEGRRLIHLGAAATYRWPPRDLLRFRSKPESYQAQYMVDTGVFQAERDLRIGVEAAIVLGAFSLQTEYIMAKAWGPGTAGNPVFPSFYLMASWVLTGEERSYRETVGAFGSVHPRNPIFTKGSWGAWELTGRYSYLDLDSEGVQGGVLHDYTLGLNGYLNDNIRLMFNYIVAHPEGVGYGHILQLRTQLSF